MDIRIISDIKEFQKIKKDWEILFEIGDYSVFQCFEFNYYSWEADLSNNNQNILCIVEVRREGILEAFLPLYIDRRKRLRFINDKHVDFCDILMNNNCNLETILSYISKEIYYSSVHFINLREDSFIYNFFQNRNIKNSYIKYFEQYSDLILSEGIFPDNYEKYKSKNKAVFRRIKRKHNDKSHYILSKDTDNFPGKEVRILKEKMISLGLRDSGFLNKNLLMLIEKLFNSERLVVSVIKKEEEIYALSFILKNSDRYLFWISLFENSKMIHICNYISFMEAVSGDNKIKISFGRGTYNYKVINFKPDIKRLFAVFIFKNKLQRIMFLFMEKIKAMIKLMYKNIAR